MHACPLPLPPPPIKQGIYVKPTREREALTAMLVREGYLPVWLESGLLDAYYNGFCNRWGCWGRGGGVCWGLGFGSRAVLLSVTVQCSVVSKAVFHHAVSLMLIESAYCMLLLLSVVSLCVCPSPPVCCGSCSTTSPCSLMVGSA